MANEITRKPSKVSYLSAPALSIGQGTAGSVQVGWKNPAGNTKSDSKSRATGIGVVWNVTCWPSTYSKRFTDIVAASATTASLVLGGAGGVLGSAGMGYFYPVGKAHLLSVTCTVHPYNSVGQATDAKATTTFEQPPAPTPGEATLDDSNGHLSCAFEVPEPPELAPIKDARYRITTYDSKYPKNASYSRTITGELTDEPVEVDIPEYLLGDFANGDRFCKVRFAAWCRGYRKDSETVSKVVFVSRPRKPVIKSVTVPSTASADKVAVTIDLCATEQHPTTGCRLQVLRSVTYTEASQIPVGAAWSDGDVQDDGECVGLVVPVEECVPDADTVTWVRVKAWNLSESALTNYSEPRRLTKLETESPTAEDDDLYLAELERSGNDSILLHAYWGRGSHVDDSDGTEVTWSDDGFAWASTRQPESFQTDRDDGAKSVMIGGNTATRFQGHVDLYVRGLTPGTRYYVKARRYKEGEGGTTYGRWSEKRSVLVGTPPKAITLSVPAQVATGKSMQFAFAIDAEDDVRQRSRWILLANPQKYHLDGPGTALSGVQVKRGTGGSGGSVGWPDIKRNVKSDGPLKYVDLLIYAGWGGTTVESDVVRVYVMDAPRLKVVTHTVTAQPATFEIICDMKLDVTVTAVVKARGCSGADEVLLADQEPGDCVWSSVIEDVMWDENRDPSTRGDYPYSATVEMDRGIDLRDGAAYVISCSAAYDISSLARGATAGGGDALVGRAGAATFGVQWSHQAPPPGPAAITTSDTVDAASGTRKRAATISLARPTGYADGDRYDVFRVTPDGPQLIAEGKGLASTVGDGYAPYGDGDLAYRVCTRSEDGDRTWADFGYVFPAYDMQVDFDGMSVNLPYDLSIGDSYGKDFESRPHLGAKEAEGYWNETVSRKASLAADVVRVEDNETAARLRSLARFPGPCFVRLPNGCAYEADVQVTGMDESCESPVLSVAITATEVGSTGAFYER